MAFRTVPIKALAGSNGDGNRILEQFLQYSDCVHGRSSFIRFGRLMKGIRPAPCTR
jgi:hypothetical protein